MSESHERLIDAAMRAFDGNAEQKLAARQWMGEQVIETDEVTLDATTRRWEEVDRRKRNGFFSGWGLIGWTVISLALVYPFYEMVRDTEDSLSALGSGPFGIRSRDTKWWITEDLSPDQKLLLGDPTKPLLARKEALWKSDPDNPAYFAEYAGAYDSVHHALPADYFEIANRIDPDNGWFDYFAAVSIGEKAVESLERTEKERRAGTPLKWNILKEKQLNEALAIIRSARDKPRFQSYGNSLFRQRIALLPQRDSTERVVSLLSTFSHESGSSLTYKFVNLSHLLAARSGQLTDVTEFKELLLDCRHMIQVRMGSEDILIADELVTFNTVLLSVTALQSAAEKLGLVKEAAELNTVKLRFQNYRDELKRKDTADRIAKSIYKDGSQLANLVAPSVKLVKKPPALSQDEIRTGGLVDRDQISRSCSILLWGMLGACSVAVFAYRFRTTVSVRMLAVMVEKLLLPVDWVWILGSGVLLPVGCFMVAWVFTPLSNIGVFAEPEVNFIILGSLVVVISLLIARWRLVMRTKVFGFPAKYRVGWLMVLSLLIFASFLQGGVGDYFESIIGGWLDLFVDIWVEPVFGGEITWRFQMIKWTRVLLLGLPAAWLSVVIFKSIFSPSEKVLPRLVMSRVLSVAYPAGMAAMAMAAFGFHLSQQYWFERDHLMKMTVEEPGISPYEYRVAKQKRLETRELLGKFGP